MAKNVISLGLIGLSDFENDPLFQAITVLQRYQLNAAYSSCYQKLHDLSRQLKVTPFASFRLLAASEQVQGLIWNHDAVRLCPEQLSLGHAAKHMLVRSDVLHTLPVNRLLSLQEHATDTQTEIFPELLHRWTPTTLRVRELIATQLGPVEKINIKNVSKNGYFSSLFQTIDWLRMLLSLNSVAIRTGEDRNLYLNFERFNSKNVACVVEQKEYESSEANAASVQIECEAGRIELISTINMRWSKDSDQQEETLAEERSAEEVMLDLFGRRIAGGIVPVPDLMEVFRTQRLLAAIEASQPAGEVIHIDDNSLPINDGKICF